jgi:Sec-independent protein translocase protein TatA
MFGVSFKTLLLIAVVAYLVANYAPKLPAFGKTA